SAPGRDPFDLRRPAGGRGAALGVARRSIPGRQHQTSGEHLCGLRSRPVAPVVASGGGPGRAGPPDKILDGESVPGGNSPRRLWRDEPCRQSLRRLHLGTQPALYQRSSLHDRRAGGVWTVHLPAAAPVLASRVALVRTARPYGIGGLDRVFRRRIVLGLVLLRRRRQRSRLRVFRLVAESGTRDLSSAARLVTE